MNTRSNTNNSNDKPMRNGLRPATNVLVSVLGALAIVFMVNYLSSRHYVRSDWTGSQIYTLSQKSLGALDRLDKQVDLLVLWSHSSDDFPAIRELVERYAAASPSIELELIDPDLNAERVQLIVDKYGAKKKDVGMGMMAIDASVIVISGDNVKFVTEENMRPTPDLMTSLEGAATEALSEYNAEQALTSAILHVTSEKLPVVCFSQGHGEWVFDSYGARGLGHLKDELTQDGYKTAEIATLSASRIPRVCELVAVVGPEKAFLSSESALFDQHLKRGGRLLLLLDPVAHEDRFAPTGFEQMLSRYGIEAIGDFIIEVDTSRLISQSPLTFLASEFTNHAAVDHLSLSSHMSEAVRQQIGAPPVVFAGARSLVQKETDGHIADVLARSSDVSWGESDLASFGSGDSVPERDQYDTPGPVGLAMAVSLETSDPDERPGRMVVVGDSDFLSEELFVNAGLYNREFWSGVVGWLTEREDLISIGPKNPEHIRLNLSSGDVLAIWQTVGFEALLFVLLGVYVWLRRRN